MLDIDRLAERRLLKKYTHKDMALKLGITRQGYGNYESGKRDVDTETLVKISEILETNSAYLLGENNDPSPIKSGTKINQEETNLSFYGGPENWSEDEIAEAEAAVRRYREMKKRAAEEAKKHNK